MEGVSKFPERREGSRYSAMAAEIIHMADEDQAMRNNVLENNGEWDAEVDRRNTARMKEIVEEIGWPTISKVGEEASYQAWLIVQHATDDLEFMKHCLELMRAEPAAEVNQQNIAYMDDRLRVFEGRPQRYGTQFKEIDGKYEPFEIEEPENVDRLRRAIGLDPLEQELKEMNLPDQEG